MCPQVQQNLSRQIADWQFVENSQFTFDLPKIQDVESIQLVLDGIVTVTADGTAVRAEAPSQLVNRCSLIAGGKNVLDDVLFTNWVFGNHKRKFQNMVVPPSTFTAVGGPYPVRATAMLDRNNINGWRPKDSSFQAWLTDLFQLRITSGAAIDLFAGGAIAATFAGTFRVIIHSFDELLKSEGGTDRGEPKQVIKRTTQSLTYSAANSAREFDLPIGNQHRAIKLHSWDNVNTRGIGEPSNALINSAQYDVDDTDVRFNLDFADLREKNAGDLGIPIGDMPVGIGVLDFSPRGKFSDYSDLTQASESTLTLDLAAPTGNGKIVIETEEVIV